MAAIGSRSPFGCLYWNGLRSIFQEQNIPTTILKIRPEVRKLVCFFSGSKPTFEKHGLCTRFSISWIFGWPFIFIDTT